MSDKPKQAKLGDEMHVQTLRMNKKLYDKLQKKVANTEKSINKTVNEAIELYLKRSEV